MRIAPRATSFLGFSLFLSSQLSSFSSRTPPRVLPSAVPPPLPVPAPSPPRPPALPAAEDGARGGQGRVDPSPPRPSGEIRRRRAIPSPTAAQVTGRDLPWGDGRFGGRGRQGRDGGGPPASLDALQHAPAGGEAEWLLRTMKLNSAGDVQQPKWDALEAKIRAGSAPPAPSSAASSRASAASASTRAPPSLSSASAPPRAPSARRNQRPVRDARGMRLSAASAGGASSLSFPQVGLVAHGEGEHCWS
jgi:hypothetical protein